MIDVAGIEFRRHADEARPHHLTICPCEAPPPIGPLREVRKTRPKDGSLQFVETGIHARLDVMVPVGLATVPKPFEPVRERHIRCRDGTGVRIRLNRGLGRFRLRVRDRCRAQSLAVKPESLIRV